MCCILYIPWVLMKFLMRKISRGSSHPRVQTQDFHIAGGFFTTWATREAWGNCVKYFIKQKPCVSFFKSGIYYNIDKQKFDFTIIEKWIWTSGKVFLQKAVNSRENININKHMKSSSTSLVVKGTLVCLRHFFLTTVPYDRYIVYT